ncbi:MAG: M6 family metalloprotease domain-containing protein [Fidelibacterota bacterium]|nr:MAG: M6 family metalloprotease domain-containing protein [Candidatus Neomarinimicrobiota bacterium]
MKHTLTYLATLCLLLSLPARLPAIPPHPRLRDMINQREIPEPYYLKNLSQLRQTGLNNSFVRMDPVLLKDASVIHDLYQITPAGNWNLLVILIDFSDKPAQVEPAFFDSLIFHSTSISVRNYYGEVSYGNLDLVTVNFPSQTGWQRADSISTYYTTDETGTPNGGTGEYPRNAQKLVEEAVIAIDPFVDFNDYDNDNDHYNYVDGLLVVHAGTGGEAEGIEENIWSHSWVTSEPVPLESPSNRVYAYRYAIVPEYWLFDGDTSDMTIGVFAHELGHSLFGLPDLYDIDGSSNGLGGWSLMAYGSWNGPNHIGASPSHPDAWSRALMGFAAPVNVTTDLISQSVSPVEIFPVMYQLWTDNLPGNEYFLVEHRMLTGYDQYLPGQGLLIYHVDENVDWQHTQNENEWYPGYTTEGHYLVALEQADGEYDLEHKDWADSGDPFPGNVLKSAFSNITSPSSLAYSGQWTGVAVTQIADLDNGIVANLTVNPLLDSVSVLGIADVPDDEGGSVIISWSPIAADSGVSSTISGYTIWLQASDLHYSAGSRVLPYDGGHWEYCGFLEADSAAFYQLAVQTFMDSNATGLNKSYFRIAASQNDSLVVAVSAITEGYSVDNRAPESPVNLAAASSGTAGVRLTWHSNNEADLGVYRIYRGSSSEFIPAHIDSFVSATSDTFYIDNDPVLPTPYYRVAALDYNGNISEYSEAVTPGTVIVAENIDLSIPGSFQLYQNYPNPFNPNTTIRFDLPSATYVRILVFDLQGREIRRLIDGRLLAGQHLAQWDGLSSDGRESPAGIYIVRLETSRFIANRKMVLLK